MLAEKYIRLYNRLDGKPSSREKLVRLHAEIKKEIDAKRIDKHSPLGIELFSIESRLATAIASIHGPFDVEEIKVKKIDINAYVKLASQAQIKPKVVIRKVVKTVIRKIRVKAKVEKPAAKRSPRPAKADHLTSDMLYGLEYIPCSEEKDYADESPTLGFTKEGQQKIYDMITGMILKVMKDSKELPWQKPWSIKSILATNFKTKTKYKGANLFLLNLIAPTFFGKHGPYWLTFKQVKDLGGHVKAGSSAFPVIYYSIYYSISVPTRKTITEEQYKAMSDEQKKKSGAIELFTINYYNVFPQEDIEGIDFPVMATRRTEAKEIETAKAIVDGMPRRPAIDHHNKGEAFYRPSEDNIMVPPLDFFRNDQEYYSTLFHELVHSTGHESRLDRFEANKKVALGKAYAFEELIAEMGASYLNAESGILYFTLKNSAAYLKGWQKDLENIMADDNKFFLKASAKAAQAADFILDRSAKEETVTTPTEEVKLKRTSDRPPVPGKKPRQEGTRVISATALAGMEFETLPFEGKWKEHLGIPSKNFSAMVWGKPKQGKTHYAFQLADYVSQFGSVLYVLSDEGVGHTVKEKIRQNGLDKNDQVSFIETRQVSEVTKALDSGNYKFVVLDLISNMKQDEENLSPDQFHSLRERYPAISFIPVFSSTKAGNFRGTQDWGHDVDVLVDVENGVATAQGRFGGGEYKIFPDAVIEKEDIKKSNANPVKI